jgi:hypothetical protein
VNINLHIERLVVDGLELDPAKRDSFKSGIESELTALLTAGGVDSTLSAGVAVPRIEGPSIQLQPDNSPQQLGRQIAGSIYGGIGR